MDFVTHPETELMVATISHVGRRWMLILYDGQGDYVGTEWHPSREAGRDHAGRLLVSASCDCGGRTVARWNNLRTGVTRSCGCRKRAGRRRNTSAQYGDERAAAGP